MKLNIKNSIDNPVGMEKIYRTDKNCLKSFLNLSEYLIIRYQSLESSLDFDRTKSGSVKIGMNDILLLIIACLYPHFH